MLEVCSGLCSLLRRATFSVCLANRLAQKGVAYQVVLQEKKYKFKFLPLAG